MEVQQGIYRHYKGNEYRVILVGKHTETSKDMVVYGPTSGDGQVWIRPLDMFMSSVEIDGETRPRFEYIGEAA